MAEANKTPDQSMEEILQSIKRIIAEEGDPAPSGSDVLELTEIVPEDTSPANETDGVMAVEQLLDTLADQPQAVADDALMFNEPAPEPEPEPVVAAPMAEPEPAFVEPPPAPPAIATPSETLLEDTTLHASASALKQLLTPPTTHAAHYVPIGGDLQFRSGNTVEDLVIEALRPMLKEWLDANLPSLVERLVQREIQKIVSSLH